MQYTITLGELLIALCVLVLLAVVVLNRRDEVKRQETKELEKVVSQRNRKIAQMMDHQSNIIRRIANTLRGISAKLKYQLSEDPNCGVQGNAVFVKSGNEPILSVFINVFRSEGKEVMYFFGRGGEKQESGIDDVSVANLINRFVAYLHETKMEVVR